MQDDRLIKSVYVWNYGRNKQARKSQERVTGQYTRMVQYGHVQLLQRSTVQISLANNRTSGSGHQRALSPSSQVHA